MPTILERSSFNLCQEHQSTNKHENRGDPVTGMSVYVVVDNDVHNPVAYKKYLELITPTVGQYNGRYIIRAGEITFADTDWRPDRLVVIAFPTKADAMRWVTAEDVKPMHNMRRANATSRLIVIEGFEESKL